MLLGQPLRLIGAWNRHVLFSCFLSLRDDGRSRCLRSRGNAPCALTRRLRGLRSFGANRRTGENTPGGSGDTPENDGLQSSLRGVHSSFASCEHGSRVVIAPPALNRNPDASPFFRSPWDRHDRPQTLSESRSAFHQSNACEFREECAGEWIDRKGWMCVSQELSPGSTNVLKHPKWLSTPRRTYRSIYGRLPRD